MLTLSAITILAATTFALANPFERRDVHCGTTCRSSQMGGNTRKLRQGVVGLCVGIHGNWYLKPESQLFNHEAYNVACHGNCCVYVAGDNAFEDPQGGFVIDGDRIFQEAAGLMGCGDPNGNTINAMQSFSDSHATCVSDGNGCGDGW